jgi:hypothetical protein
MQCRGLFWAADRAKAARKGTREKPARANPVRDGQAIAITGPHPRCRI